MNEENGTQVQERKSEVAEGRDALAQRADQMNDVAIRLRERLAGVLRGSNKEKDPEAPRPQFETPLANSLAGIDDSFRNSQEILADVLDRLEV